MFIFNLLTGYMSQSLLWLTYMIVCFLFVSQKLASLFIFLILSTIQNGCTGLMRAICGDSISTVKVLLEAKADPNVTDEVKLHYSHCLYL